MLPHRIGRSASKGVDISSGQPQNWGSLKTLPRIIPFPYVLPCYHVECGRSTSKDVGIGREPQKLGARWDPALDTEDVHYTMKTCPLPIYITVTYRSEFGRSNSKGVL